MSDFPRFADSHIRFGIRHLNDDAMSAKTENEESKCGKTK